MAERIQSVSGTTSVCPACAVGATPCPPAVPGVPARRPASSSEAPALGTPGPPGANGGGYPEALEQDKPFLVPTVGFRKPAVGTVHGGASQTPARARVCSLCA